MSMTNLVVLEFTNCGTGALMRTPEQSYGRQLVALFYSSDTRGERCKALRPAASVVGLARGRVAHYSPTLTPWRGSNANSVSAWQRHTRYLRSCIGRDTRKLGEPCFALPPRKRRGLFEPTPPMNALSCTLALDVLL